MSAIPKQLPEIGFKMHRAHREDVHHARLAFSIYVSGGCNQRLEYYRCASNIPSVHPFFYRCLSELGHEGAGAKPIPSCLQARGGYILDMWPANRNANIEKKNISLLKWR